MGEATDENGRLEEERGNEHNWNDDSNEAEELCRALAMSLVAAVGGGGRRQVRESIMEEMEAALMLFMLKSMKSRRLRKICNKNTSVMFNFFKFPHRDVYRVTVRAARRTAHPHQ